MKRLLGIVLAALLTACASVSTPNGQLMAAYNTTNAYVDLTRSSLARGRITPDQATRARANAKKAVEALDMAAAALVNCAAPCAPYTSIMQGLQPTLLELEAELRKKEESK
jgi:hypothetical protein